MSFKWSIPSLMAAGRPRSEATVAYTAEVFPGALGGTKSINSVTGWTPDTPFTLPANGGDGLQTRNAVDVSPITMIVGANSNAKGAALFFKKNTVTQQTIPISGTPADYTSDPISIDNGDTISVELT